MMHTPLQFLRLDCAQLGLDDAYPGEGDGGPESNLRFDSPKRAGPEWCGTLNVPVTACVAPLKLHAF